MSSQMAPLTATTVRPEIGLPNLAEFDGLGEQIYSYLFGCALKKHAGVEIRVPCWRGASLFENPLVSRTHQSPVQWLTQNDARTLLRDGVDDSADLDGDLMVPASELGLSSGEIREALPFSKHLGPLLAKIGEGLLKPEQSLVVVYLHHDEATDPTDYMGRIASIRRWLAQRLSEGQRPVLYLAGSVTDAAHKALSVFRPVIAGELNCRSQPTAEQLDYYLMAQADRVITMGGPLALAARIRCDDGDLFKVEAEGITECDPWSENPLDWTSKVYSLKQEISSAVESFGRRDFSSTGMRLHRALREQPNNPDALASMASLRFTCGDYRQAHYWFRRASKVERDNEELAQAAEVSLQRLDNLRDGDRFAREKRFYSLNQLDQKLVEHLNFEGGFFIEAGGNDGVSQSNTLFFERYLGWKGLLIEPIPPLAQLCLHNRPGALVENCALVPFDYEGLDVEMRYCNLMSVVRGGMKSQAEEDAHIKAGEDCQRLKSFDLKVPARTITSVLERFSIEQIDLFSLDVEGFELQVLQGLDLERYRPRFMLIEARYRDEIDGLLSPYYEPIAELSHHDVLYKSV